MNPKEFFKKWKQGILNLSPEQQLKGRMIGLKGGILGLILALTTLIIRRMWGFSIFVFFIIWIQVISYISTRQQLIATKEMMKEAGTQEQDNNSALLDKELGNTK